MTAIPRKKHNAFAKICQLAGRAVEMYDMIRAEDRIVIGLSWGQDSTVLTHVLHRLREKAPFHFDLHAVWVDGGFNAGEAPRLQAYAEEHSWSLEIVRLPITEILRDKGNEETPCSLCARLRRGKLHGVMDRIGYKTLALGQHRDDLVTTFLMSAFRGSGLMTMGPHVPADRGRKRLIRPLCLASKPLIAEAVEEMGLPIIAKCPYIDQLDETGDRAYVERLLDELEGHYPGVRHALRRSLSDLRPPHLMDPRFNDLIRKTTRA
ncbi:MAG: hypothetical protein HN742_17065 [Lentisphaerae bacterium]|nr:hypothetical protein [Lentisphaerota bacterium]MBT4815947.1 hypothetical protein [Lentisphaerota bacterium]MBT5606873.1 hypothetical protein [Lentisphaerota bacterium]MBT7059020.1 hypothetical protein [Lentisphaerota bacterium]MBT7843592.1 hypothetical protein [Lentisphaerota bacterium]